VSATLLDRSAPALFVLLWSTGFIGARFGLPYIEPLQFLVLRYGCVLLLLVLVALAVRAPWPARAQIPHIASAGIMIHAGYLGGVFVAIKHGMAAGVAALIVGLQPILTALAARPLLGEHISWRQWTGLALGIAGVALVVWHKTGGSREVAVTSTAIVVALLSITAGTLYQKRYCPRFDLRTGSAIQFAASLAVTAPLALLFESGVPRWTPELGFALGWLVVVLSVGAISLLNVMIRRGSAVAVASLFYLTPPVTAIMAWLLFGESLPLAACAGMLVAVIGVALARRA
jgi:drug/metabolite transporter (DMT)-like permease